MTSGGTDPNHVLLLGELKGLVHGMLEEQREQTALMQSMDSRLRQQETKAAKLGAVSGGVVSVGMALLIDQARAWLQRGGGSNTP